MGGMLFLLAIAGAVFDWKYHRAGGKPSSRNDRIRFWVIALLVAGASAFTEFAGWDPYGILGHTTVPLVAEARVTQKCLRLAGGASQPELGIPFAFGQGRSAVSGSTERELAKLPSEKNGPLGTTSQRPERL
jgi:hypothetical protein